METRPLGRTGHDSSLITLGGHVAQPEIRDEVDEYIQYALDHGVNHVDIAPTYGSGEAEIILGEWVREYRDDLFLACKTRKRTKREAAKELQESLKRLQTDYFDLYQFHALDPPGELETVMGEDGALKAVLEAREEGQVNYIGITSHNPQNILRALEAFPLDTVLLPVNYVLHAHPEPRNDYEPVLALAKERNVGVIAMKAAAKGPWPTEERPYRTWYQPFHIQGEVDEALWFTLTQDVTTAAHSSDLRIGKMMIDAAERYKPLTQEKQRELIQKAANYNPLFPRKS
jgi:aryl-alcohol dehydrogenase-like predicted oxidoreductase